MITLDVSFEIETPTGWLECEDPANGYELHKESFVNRATSHRKQEINSNWVEGSYVSQAVRENVVEEVAIYVRGDTPYELWARKQALLDGLEQLAFTARLRFGDLLETWNCEISDYTEESPMEMRFATMAVIRARIPRLPSLTRSQVVLP